MTDKSSLIRLAGDLKRIADELLDAAKEDDKEESDEEDTTDSSEDHPTKGRNTMIGLMLRKRMGK